MVSRKEMKRMTKKVLAMSSPTMVFFESVRRETTVQLPSAKILTMPKDYFLMTIQGGPEKILLETIDSFVVNSNFCENNPFSKVTSYQPTNSIWQSPQPLHVSNS